MTLSEEAVESFLLLSLYFLEKVGFCHVKGADLLLICSIAAYVIFFAYIVLIFLENP